MKIWGVVLALLLAGCGYQPAANYAKAIVGESVSTQVHVLMEDPQNTVIIKDAVDTAVITKFRTSLSSKESSQTHLDIRVTNVGFTPMRFDTNGYVITYRTTVNMGIIRTSGENVKNYVTSGVYDFDIEPNAIISDQARFEAIRQGAQKAIDTFVAQVAAEGALKRKE